MHIIPLLTVILAQLQKRDPSPQTYTQVLSTTAWTYSPSYIISYRSTQIITITSLIPCPVTTSYTTTYICATCSTTIPVPGPTQTLCAQKFCLGGNNQVSTTAYASNENAVASLTSGTLVQSTQIPGTLCSLFLPFDTATVPAAGLPRCGGAVLDITCASKVCFTSNAVSDVIVTTIASYYPGETASAKVNGVATSIPASSCSHYEFLGSTSRTVDCKPKTTLRASATDYSVITFTFVTNGVTSVSITSIPPRGGSFQLSVSGEGTRTDGLFMVHTLFWLWVIIAVIMGTGMIIL